MKRQNITGYTFMLPALIIIGLFTVVPIIYAVVMAFNKVDIVAGTYQFNGLHNFRYLLADEKFWAAVRNTFRYVVIVVPIQTIIALVLAAVLNNKIKFKRGFITFLFIPTLTSSAAMTLIFMWLFNANGLGTAFLNDLLGTKINFLSDPNWALGIIMGMNIFSTVPHFMVIYLSALQEIQPNLYEAASLDGANSLQKFFHITVPQLSPITFYVVSMGLIGCFQIFDQAYIMSSGTGGPNNATLTFTLYIYQLAFGGNATMGIAAALALILAVIIFLSTFIFNKFTEREAND
jgi:ABC-type sugar transport systems, permease components